MNLSSARRRFSLAASLLVSPIAAAVGQRDSAPAPTQAQLDEEFRGAMTAAGPLAEALVGDTLGFLASVQPYGPLDLVILKGLTPRHSDQLRNFFLGVVGGAARLDPQPFATRWHCGPPCALARRDSLLQRFSQLDTLVRQFQAMDNASVIAVWPRGGYRFGMVSFDGQRFYRSTPSPILGLLPWKAEPTDSSDQALWGRGVTRATVETFVAAMRAAGIVAIVREGPEAVRVVLRGAIGDNEAGLLFVPTTLGPPALGGAEMLDGRRYVGGEQVAPGVYFYVST